MQAAEAAPFLPPNVEATVKNVLIPIDGSENALRAVKYMIDHIREHGDCAIHLLNVQIPIVSGAVRAFVTPEMIRDYYEDESSAALAEARSVLDAAGVSYQTQMRVGPVAATITTYAAEQHCDHIVMGSRGLGAAGSLLLGSVALKVLHTAHIPVVMIN
nr:universal stress protein [Achromobacter sp. GbtcB20]